MELAAQGSGRAGSGGLTMHVNKVDHVKTIDRVAKELGENADWLYDVAIEMDTEDGVIWVYGLGDDGVMAFTDFGIENLVELIKIHKGSEAARGALRLRVINTPAAHAGCLPRKRRPSRRGRPSPCVVFDRNDIHLSD